MEETGTVTAVETSAATSTSVKEVDGIEVVIDREACVSWDAIMLSRDIQKLNKEFNSLPKGDKQAEVIMDAMALMYEYVLLTTDLTREKINAHMGDKASFKDVSEFLGHVMQATRLKN